MNISRGVEMAWPCWIVRFSAVCALASGLLNDTANATTRGAVAIETKDSPKPVKLYDRSYALVIGNDAYAGGWSRLSNAVSDAVAVAAELEKTGFQVTLLRNLKSQDLSNAFESFVRAHGGDKNARLLFWFAGHGHTISGEGYLVPTDAPSLSNQWDFLNAAFPMRRFGEYMRRVRSKHVLAVFDSCFSGSVFKVARANLHQRALSKRTGRKARQFVSSGEAQQTVSDDGTFRKLFIAALRGEEERADYNRDGYLTGTELGFFLTDRVTSLTGGSQTPRYGALNAFGYDRGDIVFPLPQAQKITKKKREAVRREKFEIAFWNSVRDSNDPEILATYLESYPSGQFATLAKVLIRSAQAAKTRRLALAQQERASREAEAAATQNADITKRKPAQAGAEATKDKSAEFDRNGGKGKPSTSVAQKTKEIELETPETSLPGTQPRTRIAALDPQIPDTAAIQQVDQMQLFRRVQAILRATGCYSGAVDGRWGPKSREALKRYTRFSKEKIAAEKPTLVTAKRLEALPRSRVCPISCRRGSRLVGGKCIADAPKRKRAGAKPPKTKEAGSRRKSKTARARDYTTPDGSKRDKDGCRSVDEWRGGSLPCP